MYSVIDYLYIPFLFIAAVQLLLSLASLSSGRRFHKYVLSRLVEPNSTFEGLVTVIVPCRGIDTGLESNLKAILGQERGGYEAIFVVDSPDDPAVPIIDRLTSGLDHARLLIAGMSEFSGQKVHNLIKAVESADKDSQAFVFVDSDACPSASWLENILSSLTKDKVGCSTGYRWFVPSRGGFATHLRSAWNASIASSLGPDTKSNFSWGGSTAIRTAVFEELQIVNHWKGTVSDDFVLSNQIKESAYTIHFEPKCLTPTVEDCSLFELFEFTGRQMKITRTYSPGHFKISLIGSAILTFTILAGISLLLFSTGFVFLLTALLLGIIWTLGTVRAILRISTISRCIPQHQTDLRRQYLSHGILWPASTILFLINDITALFSNRITWRGITYELVSESEIRILKS